MKLSLQIGQTVIMKHLQFRPNGPGQITTEQKVSTIGRKYFTLIGRNDKFDLETGFDVSEYNSSYRVYESQLDIAHEMEHRKLSEELREHFPPYGISKLNLDQLRSIKKIIE